MLANEARRLTCLLAVSAFLSCAARAPAQPETEAADALRSAVQLFDEGDYVGAQHALNQIETSHLDADGQATHAEYTQRAALAVSMFQKAETDFEASELALSEGRVEDAIRLLRAVIDNQFAAKDTRVAAQDDLRALQTAQEAAPAPAEPAPAEPPPLDETDPDITRQRQALRAKVLTRDGYQALEAGRISEAERLFRKALAQVPGYPEAAAGLERVAGHETVEAEARDLADKYRERNAIKWQRTVTTFREAEREIRELVLKNQFPEAQETLLRAGQVLESGKIAADPVSRYEALLHDLESLTRYVQDEDRRFNEQEVIRQQDEARDAHAERVRQARENKRERINALMNQALQHRKDRDYESAINVLKQVSAIDPTNDNARWLREVIEDQQAYSLQRDIHEQVSKQTQNVLIDVERSRVPWWQEITYPKNWLEIISRETRRIPGTESSGAIDPNLQSKLDEPIRLDIDGDPFDQVIERLADAHGVNISVAWGDLAAAAVDPKTPVRLRLNNAVPMRTALREVLDQVGAGRTELGYLPTDGVVKVATRDFLDRQTYEEVYDVRDLLMPVPNFDDAPSMDLSDPSIIVRSDGPSSGSSSGSAMYPSGYGEVPEKIVEEDANKLISLIRQTIDPDSWQANHGGDCSITEINGQLVITQTPTGHARIGGLLSKLREQRAIQVAVEARFITVQSNYLEELGMDLDVVLNAGNAGFDFLENPDQRGSLLLDPILGSRLLLPRSFSRLGFTPTAPTAGTTLGTGTGSGTGLSQPFNEPGLVPQRGNSLLGGRSATPIPIINNVLQLTDAGGLTSDLPGSFAGNPGLQPAFSLFGSFLDNIQVDFLIRATQADSRTSLLTAPRLVLFNGQRAWVAVVNQQSFVSSLTPITDAVGAAPTVSTIETGAVLDAQVTVSADKRYVTMTLRPSVGRLLGIQTFPFLTGANAGEGSFVQLPNISRQVLRTTVTVPDGGTLLIGGQKLAGEIEVESGVPILSKIPILKRLYSSRTLVKDEQVLLILIKPKIIIQSEAEQEAFPTFSQGN